MPTVMLSVTSLSGDLSGGACLYYKAPVLFWQAAVRIVGDAAVQPHLKHIQAIQNCTQKRCEWCECVNSRCRRFSVCAFLGSNVLLKSHFPCHCVCVLGCFFLSCVPILTAALQYSNPKSFSGTDHRKHFKLETNENDRRQLERHWGVSAQWQAH